MLIALTACLVIDADQHAARVQELEAALDTDATDTSPPTVITSDVPPTLDAVSPPYGTDAGGTLVTLSGAAFGETPDVRFGEVSAVVQSVTGGSVVVKTPASSVRGLVDVTVTTGAGEAVKRESFTYWQDATGKVAATGELAWFQYVGGWWDEATSPPYGRATLRFTEPFDYDFYQNWTPTVDSCSHVYNGVPEWVYDPQFVPIDVLTGTATEASPSGASVTLTWNNYEHRFTNYALDPGQIVAGETYGLTLEGTMGVPEITLDGVFPVPHEFTLLSPAIADAALADVTVDQHFEWTTDDEADLILLQIGLINAANDGFQEELYCALPDVGSFWMTSDMWQAWPSDRQVHILIGRYNGGDGLLPWNNGKIAVASQIWYYGVGRSR